eukprot:scaffold40628_cov98-Phaeocystis_antarctica.AAC.2
MGRMAASEKRRTLDSDTPCLQQVSPSHAAPGEHVPRPARDSVKVMRTFVVAAVPTSNTAKHKALTRISWPAANMRKGDRTRNPLRNLEKG